MEPTGLPHRSALALALRRPRAQLGRNDDGGGAAKLYNSVVTELMQCVDQYRGATGFILMAATNFYEGLDEALVREMRRVHSQSSRLISSIDPKRDMPTLLKA